MFEILKYDNISQALAMDPLTGNVTYLMVAAFSIAINAMNLLRYKTKDAELALGDISGKTNWYKTTIYVGLITELTVWSVTFITQLLSMFGIANDINYSVYTLGQQLLKLLDLPLNILVNQSKSAAKDLKKNNAAGSALYMQGIGLIQAIEMNKFDVAIGKKFTAMLLKFQKDNWKWGQYTTRDEEGQAYKLAAMELVIDEWAVENEEYLGELNDLINNVNWDE